MILAGSAGDEPSCIVQQLFVLAFQAMYGRGEKTPKRLAVAVFLFAGPGFVDPSRPHIDHLGARLVLGKDFHMQAVSRIMKPCIGKTFEAASKFASGVYLSAETSPVTL